MYFEVDRKDFRKTRVAETPPTELEPGQVRLSIERFAVTTNNITYAVAGDMLDYWGFHPTEAPWGRIPVMGLATIVESANPDVGLGGRYFGFYPMGTEAIIDAKVRESPDTPGTATAFRDAGPHRAAHAATYTDFRDVTTDAMFRPEQVDEYLLLWGMFMTSFLIDDSLADNGFHGASQTLVTSASSKTSISLAACLGERDGHRSIGLTSERNRSFVEGLGMYDQVITYDEIDQLDASTTSNLVDMAGSAPIRAAVHGHFVDNLAASITVGATHWEDRGDDTPLPGPTPEFFFAPGQSAKRAGEWGPEELAARIAVSFHALLDTTGDWLTVEHRTGPDGVESTYRDLLEGRADPAVGYVCALDPATLVTPGQQGS